MKKILIITTVAFALLCAYAYYAIRSVRPGQMKIVKRVYELKNNNVKLENPIFLTPERALAEDLFLMKASTPESWTECSTDDRGSEYEIICPEASYLVRDTFVGNEEGLILVIMATSKVFGFTYHSYIPKTTSRRDECEAGWGKASLGCKIVGGKEPGSLGTWTTHSYVVYNEYADGPQIMAKDIYKFNVPPAKESARAAQPKASAKPKSASPSKKISYTRPNKASATGSYVPEWPEEETKKAEMITADLILFLNDANAYKKKASKYPSDFAELYPGKKPYDNVLTKSGEAVAGNKKAGAFYSMQNKNGIITFTASRQNTDGASPGTLYRVHLEDGAGKKFICKEERYGGGTCPIAHNAFNGNFGKVKF